MLARILLICVMCTIAPATAEALSCSGLQQAVLATPLHAPLSSNLALLVAVDQGTPPVLHLEGANGASVPMKHARVAPGLFRYSPAKPIAAGNWTLRTTKRSRIRSLDGTMELTVENAIALQVIDLQSASRMMASWPRSFVAPFLKRPVQALPKIVSTNFVRKPFGGPWGPDQIETLTLTFDAPLPSEFVAIIGTWVRGKAKRAGVSRLLLPQSMSPTASRTQATVFTTPVRCARNPAAAVPPKDGDVATFSLLTSDGAQHALEPSEALQLATQATPE